MKINPIRQKVYKVVHHNGNGELKSAISVVQASAFGIKYLPNQLMRPRIGKIFAFNNIHDARHFANKLGFFREVWEAEGYGCENGNKRLKASSTIFSSINLLRNFWLDKNILDNNLRDTPMNTILCKSIKLIKKV